MMRGWQIVNDGCTNQQRMRMHCEPHEESTFITRTDLGHFGTCKNTPAMTVYELDQMPVSCEDKPNSVLQYFKMNGASAWNGCSNNDQAWHYKCAFTAYGLEDITTHYTTCKDSAKQQADKLTWHDAVECPNDKRLVSFTVYHPNEDNKPNGCGYGIKGIYYNSTIAIQSGKNSKYCRPNSGVVTCDSNTIGANEAFVIKEVADGKINLYHNATGKYCKHLGDGSSNRINCETDTSGGGAEHAFVSEQLASGKFDLKANNDKYCGDTGEQTNEAIQCNKNTVGDWEKYTAGGIANGGMKRKSFLLQSQIALKGGQSNKYCAFENGDGNNGVQCDRDNLNTHEKVFVHDAGDGKIALKGGQSDKYCTDMGTSTMTCNANQLLAHEKFEVVELGNGKVALKGGKDGKWCSDDGGLKCNRDSIGVWESHTVECLQYCHQYRFKFKCGKMIKDNPSNAVEKTSTGCEPSTTDTNMWLLDRLPAKCGENRTLSKIHWATSTVWGTGTTACPTRNFALNYDCTRVPQGFSELVTKTTNCDIAGGGKLESASQSGLGSV